MGEWTAGWIENPQNGRTQVMGGVMASNYWCALWVSAGPNPVLTL